MEILQRIGSIALIIGSLLFAFRPFVEAIGVIINVILNRPCITDTSTEELDKKRRMQEYYIIVIGFVLIGISSIKYLLSQ
ncbi:MAG: hypothetical protein UHN47_03480 [Lachnospiraceae bacterium]|nr:hypothetical protein [Lachnospiraceae bacterium]